MCKTDITQYPNEAVTIVFNRVSATAEVNVCVANVSVKTWRWIWPQLVSQIFRYVNVILALYVSVLSVLCRLGLDTISDWFLRLFRPSWVLVRRPETVFSVKPGRQGGRRTTASVPSKYSGWMNSNTVGLPESSSKLILNLHQTMMIKLWYHM